LFFGHISVANEGIIAKFGAQADIAIQRCGQNYTFRKIHDSGDLDKI